MIDGKLQKLCFHILSDNSQSNMLEVYSDSELEELFKFLRSNNLHVVAYTHLRKNNIELPDKISNEMKQVYYAACSVDFKRKQQLKEIIEILNDNSIDHILLKGVVLAYTIYREPFTRFMSDIDILVKDRDAAKAFKLLQKKGYNSFLETVEECEKVKHQFNQHYPVLKKEGCLPVELHTYLSEEYEPNIDGIWDRALNIDVDNLQTKIMSYEDLIHHIAMHKILHDASLNGLLGLYDISLIIENIDLDFQKLVTLSEESEYNNKKCLYVALQLIQEFFAQDLNTKIINSVMVDSYSSDIKTKFLNVIFYDFSNIDKDSFLLGLNMKDTGQNFSVVMSRLFMSPYKMGRYGGKRYEKVKLTFINLCKLYVMRYLNLSRRYSLFLIKRFFAGNNANESAELGKNCAELKHWLKT